MNSPHPVKISFLSISQSNYSIVIDRQIQRYQKRITQVTHVSSKPSAVVKESNPLKKLLFGLARRDTVSTADKARIDTFVQKVEPKLKLVSNYHKKLKPSFDICLEHCVTIVEKIPRLTKLNPPRFRDDPSIKPLFAGAEAIDILLKNAETAFPASKAPAGSERFALLTLTEKEKTIFGNKRDGDMVVTDAAMQAITFVDQNIATIVAEEKELRKALVSYCFTMITELAKEHLQREITQLSDLKQQREMLRTMVKMAKSNKKQSITADGHDGASLAALLQETDAELTAAREKGDTPEKWIKYLINFLSWPETVLRIDTGSQRLDWANVITENPVDKATTVTLATFIVEGKRAHKGVILHYNKE